MAKPPAFQFYAGDFLSDEDQRLMTLEEVGAYIRLIASEWKEGSLPEGLRKLARLCSCSNAEMERIWPEICQKFEPHPDLVGRIIHPRNERERERQASRSASAKRGADARWHPKRNAESEEKDANAPPLDANAQNSDAHGMPFLKSEVEEEDNGVTDNKKRKRRKTYPPEFEEVWAIHRRGPKGKAFEEYCRSDIEQAHIMAALRSYVEHEINERFNGHDLFRWIRDERWEQEEGRKLRGNGKPTAEGIGREIDKLREQGIVQ